MVKCSKSWKAFKAAQKGSVAVTFAISLIPLLAAAGLAIDLARHSMIQTQLSGALDAASLAGASAPGKTDVERIAIANAAFKINLANTYAAKEKGEAAFKVENGSVKGAAKATMESTFLALVGIDESFVGVSNEVGIPVPKKAEVALVLDYSGSMKDPAGGQIKYKAMSTAATKLIDDLTAKDPTKVKIGLVPFSHHVYATLPGYAVLNATGSSWTGCTHDQKYPFNVGDQAPTSNLDSKWNQATPDVPDQSNDCQPYAYHNLVVRPLTNSFSSLKAQLASMTPYAYTNVALGAEFGYQMVSPKGVFGNAASYSDKSTSKFLVILTDGKNTAPTFGSGGAFNLPIGTNLDVPQTDANLAAVCQNAKASGISVVTIAYDLDASSPQQKLLRDCATDPAKDFFVVNSGNEVANAFASITSSIQQQAYLYK